MASSTYAIAQTLHELDEWLPLRVLVSEHRWLAQADDFAQVIEQYAYDG